MSYFSLHAYDADVWLREFRGLNQADIEMNPDIRFAAEVENAETIHGVLQPQAAYEVMDGPVKEDGQDVSPRVETLAVFTRRWYEGDGSHDWYVCCAGGKLYNRQANAEHRAWDEMMLPIGVDAFQSSAWSWVTYEDVITVTEDGEEVEKNIDVLLMSNAKDGMIKITPPERNTTWGDVAGTLTWGDAAEHTWEWMISEKWTVTFVDTRNDPTSATEVAPKFGVIERFGERIWGTALDDEPDRMVYSKAYDPEDWKGAREDEQPEDGAGDIYQPSWDGDRFFALKRFGDQLLAFKRNKIWRILGLTPDTFNFHEQYGRGTEYPNTIVVDGERVYMATFEGLSVYDGMNTTPYAKEQTEQIWRTVNKAAMDQMCAAMFDRRYYLSFPTGDSPVNNALLVYDFNEGNILFYPDMMIEAFLPTNEELFATSSSLPGKIIRLHTDSWAIGEASGHPVKWVTPWMDFGYKRIQKGGFDFYFLPEVQDEAVTFTITIQTEKKAKTKEYTCQPLTEEQKAVPKEHRMKRLHFGGSGRKFRIIIETGEGVTAPWRIIGGLQLVVETDPD